MVVAQLRGGVPVLEVLNEPSGTDVHCGHAGRKGATVATVGVPGSHTRLTAGEPATLGRGDAQEEIRSTGKNVVLK